MTNDKTTIELNKLYNKLLPSIRKMFSNYSYLQISQDRFEKLIKSFLLEIYSKQGKEKLETEIYIKKLKTYLDAYVKMTIKEPENTNNIINNYINKRLHVNNNSQDNIKELRKLSNFLEKYDFIPTPDTWVELIKMNGTLSSILEIIVESNITLITKEGIESIDLDNIVITLIDVYCMLNNITYQKKEDAEELELEYDASNLDQLRVYLLEIRKPLLTAEEERDLAIKASNGNMYAREKLIERNLRWVVRIARGYQNRGLDLAELIQEGNIGLITAVDKYDYTKGFRLTTYARHWIRQAIIRAIQDKGRNIKLPVHIQEKLSKFKIASIGLEKKLNRQPTIEELAKELRMSVEKVQELMHYQQDTVSLNVHIGDEDDTELEHFVPSDEETVEESYAKKLLPKELQNFLAKCNLTEREINILMLRNGFFGEPKKLEEVAQIHGVTRERIRQVENKALKKIRRSKNIKDLADWTSNPAESLRNISAFRAYYNAYNDYQSANRSLQKKDGMGEIQEILENTQQLEIPIPIPVEEVPAELIVSPVPSITPKVEIPKPATFTIFDNFINLGYTKEEVLTVIEELPNLDRKRLNLRNGFDLDNPVISPYITERDRELYIRITLPKIEKLLKTKYGSRKNKKAISSVTTKAPKIADLPKEIKKGESKIEEEKQMKQFTIFEYFKELGYSKEQVLSELESLTDKELELIKLRNGQDLNNPVYNSNIPQNKRVAYANLLKKIMKRLATKYGKPNDTSKPSEAILATGNETEEITVSNEPSEEVAKVANEAPAKDLSPEGESQQVKDEQTGKQSKKKGKARKSIIKKFEELGYTKEEILLEISQLSEIDKEVIAKMDGEDLDNPVKGSNTTKKDEAKYYQTIIPKIKRALKKTYGDRTIENKLSNEGEIFPEEPVKEEKTSAENHTFEIPPITNEDVRLALQDETSDSQAAVLMSIFQDKPSEVQSSPIVETPLASVEEEIPVAEPGEKLHKEENSIEKEPAEVVNTMSKKDYIKILELLKTPTFYELITKLPPKKAIIIALRLGYIDGKYFSTESIAAFLEIEQSEVREITTEILNLHKENLNNMIDAATVYLTQSSHARKLEQR